MREGERKRGSEEERKEGRNNKTKRDGWRRKNEKNAGSEKE